MEKPTRRVGMTWLGWLNFLVLQWFFVRLVYIEDHDDIEWGIGIGLVPLTGWSFLPWRLRGLGARVDWARGGRCRYLLAIHPWIVDAALYLVALVGMVAFIFAMVYLAWWAAGVLP